MPNQATGFLARLGTLKKPIVAVASVGAVLSGLVGYYTTYRTVAQVQTQTDAPKSIATGPSIAVLPFADMSQAKDQEYFSDGIADELLNTLAKVPKLRVIARTSSFSFKGKQVSISDIARTLNVSTILEGSVRRSGAKVRVTVQLVRAADSAQLWSQTYDREMDDILKVQDDITSEVVSQLKITLAPVRQSAKPIDTEAYALLLKAKYVARQDTPETNAQAVLLYKQVLAAAPDSVAAWNGLASIYLRQSSWGGYQHKSTSAELQQQALKAIDAALALDPNNAMAHANRGQLYMGQDLMTAAATHLQRAIDIDPGNPDILINVSRLLVVLGRSDEGVALSKYLADHDPTNPATLTALGRSYYLSQRWEESVAAGRAVLALSPNFNSAHYRVAASLLMQGKAAEALTEINLEPSEAFRLIGQTAAFHALGRKAESDATLQKLNDKYVRDWSFNIAGLHAFRDEPDLAFAALDKAIAYQDPGMILISTSPLLMKLHKDPRWMPLLKKLGRSPEQVKAVRFDFKLPT